MSRDAEAELSAEERRAFGGLAREKAPLPLLEERVVEALKHSQLLLPARSVSGVRARSVGLAVAASLVFMLGAVVGSGWASKSGQKDNGPDFVLLLRSAPGQRQSRSSDEIIRMVEEYSRWAGHLRGQGVHVDGEKLASETLILRGPGGRDEVPENHMGASRDAIAGYFLIRARDYEQAVRIAEACPHLKYGGTVEVRRIERF